MNTKINHIYIGNFSMAPVIGTILSSGMVGKEKRTLIDGFVI